MSARIQVLNTGIKIVIDYFYPPNEEEFVNKPLGEEHMNYVNGNFVFLSENFL